MTRLMASVNMTSHAVEVCRTPPIFDRDVR
jgi:hypothetical protein